MSSTRERLFLFTIEDENNLYFYSSPQPQISDESTCLVVPTTRYHVQQKQSLAGDCIYTVGSPFPGFVCLERQNTMAIWNPVTGDSVSLPKVELQGKAEPKFPRSYYIYKEYTVNDPVDKQSNVVLGIHTVTHDEHHLLRVDNENHLWRIPQCKTHHPLSNGVCIDGVVYYTARRAGSDADSWIVVFVIVCSHVSSEEFSFINIHEDMAYSTLINYKGKLALLKFLLHKSPLSPTFLEFCVLQDPEKNIFSKRIYTLPLLLSNNILDSSQVDVLGMTGTGDVLVLSLYPKHGPDNIYYFNLENNRFTRVQIQGLEVFNDYKIHISLDNVENFKQCPTLRLDM